MLYSVRVRVFRVVLGLSSCYSCEMNMLYHDLVRVVVDLVVLVVLGSGNYRPMFEQLSSYVRTTIVIVSLLRRYIYLLSLYHRAIFVLLLSDGRSSFV